MRNEMQSIGRWLACIALVANVLLAGVTSALAQADADGDGVPDDLDGCPNTPAGMTVWTHETLDQNPHISRDFLGCAHGEAIQRRRGSAKPIHETQVRHEAQNHSDRFTDAEMIDLGYDPLPSSHRISELPEGARMVFMQDVRLLRQSAVLSNESPRIDLAVQGDDDLVFIPAGTAFIVTGNTTEVSQKIGREDTYKYDEFYGWYGRRSLVGGLQLVREEMTQYRTPVQIHMNIALSTVFAENMDPFKRRLAFTKEKDYQRDRIGELSTHAHVRFYMPRFDEDDADDHSLRGLRVQLLPQSPGKFFYNLATFLPPKKSQFMLDLGREVDFLGTGDQPGVTMAAWRYAAQLVVLELVRPVIDETTSAIVAGPVSRSYARKIARYEQRLAIDSYRDLELNKLTSLATLKVATQALRSLLALEDAQTDHESLTAMLVSLGRELSTQEKSNRLSDQQLGDIQQIFREHEEAVAQSGAHSRSAVFALVLGSCQRYFN